MQSAHHCALAVSALADRAPCSSNQEFNQSCRGATNGSAELRAPEGRVVHRRDWWLISQRVGDAARIHCEGSTK